MLIEFAELVGLLCHYRQEKGQREALDRQKFIERLKYHRHEEIDRFFKQDYIHTCPPSCSQTC